ncbi:MAG: DUF4595 domain-containing protein [Alistipes senegalensis]|nr:DUF4595 domain-containing protein [Bacteroides cellulosilyticus]MCM1351222.1 DUF4595 domain-containing protein [Alistipes senegalensis]
MMKSIFHRMSALSVLAMMFVAGCGESNDDGPKPVELTGGTKTQQTVYADDEQAPAPIKFTAAAAWTATVAEVQTKAAGGSEVDWLTLSAYSGGAGEVSLNMRLDPNYTGTDRKAEIRIECAGTTLKITVEQKGTKQDGTKPAPDQPTTDPKNRIVRIDEKYLYYETDNPIDEYYEFAYDKTGRVAGIKRVRCGNSEYETEENTTVTYGNKTIVYEIAGKEKTGKENWTITDTAVLDEHGRAVSENFSGVEEYEGERHPFEASYRFTYDADGYLVKTEDVDEDSNEADSYRITWTNGNPTQVIWTYADRTTIDRATYGTVENKANLDLNWFIALQMEGWHYSVGENPFLAAMGYMGKRSKYMAETVTGTGAEDNHSYTNEYQFDSEGRIVKITSDDEVYTIHYAE